jgi:hypothetical protein
MKAKEMAVDVSALTWDAVLNVVREGSPEGFTNQELAEAFETDYRRVAAITKLMFEAGALSRVLMGKSDRATTLYFLSN